MSVDERFPYVSPETSVISKDWAAGSAKCVDSYELVVKVNSAQAEWKTVSYPPALWKIIDEPIVNALDHCVRCAGTGRTQPVTEISVNYDTAGRVRVYNDGPGIEVVEHPTASKIHGRTVYLPTLIFGELFQGSNLVRSPDSIIGGTNGLGAKLSNCFSTEFIVETVRDGKFFQQKWQKNKTIECTPIIYDVDDSRVPKAKKMPHTVLSFMPDYVNLFGYKDVASIAPLMVDLVYTRMLFAAVYAKTINPAVKIRFNDKLIPHKTMQDLAAVFFPGRSTVAMQIMPTVSKHPEYKYPWEVCVVCVDPARRPAAKALTNINGCVVREGKHVDRLLTQVTEGIVERLREVKVTAAQVSHHLFLLANTRIPCPSWTGQRKDVFVCDMRLLAGYVMPVAQIDKTAAMCKQALIDEFMDSIPGATGKRKKVTTDPTRYRGANRAGTRQSTRCSLIFVEGKSAMTQGKTGISAHLNWDYYGIYSTGGVPMNFRKQCTIRHGANTKHVKKSAIMAKNAFLADLENIVGLNTAYNYDTQSPTYSKEIAELNYGALIACVDQDDDGKGNIFGIILSTFELFWPNLIKAGFIKWFCSPIVWVYPASGARSTKVLAFYNLPAYKAWEDTADMAKYKPKYCKGLGTHSRTETLSMFAAFTQNLFTYYLDDRSAELFNIYFGTDPDLRKKELSKAAVEVNAALILKQSAEKMVSCSDHLLNDTNAYQKDNLDRKLDNVIDGQNQAGRKILDGFIKAFVKAREYKVAQLAGYISKKENYHHGEESLTQSIKSRGFVGVGGKQLPLIVPLSSFGSRRLGGKDAASARYIYAALNRAVVGAVFPAADYHLLDFNFSEGVRCEPRHFVPIIPMAAIESTELPGHGWKLKLWARDVFSVIKNVRRMIVGGDNCALVPMPPCRYAGGLYEWKGEFRTIRGRTYSFGRYEVSSAAVPTILITELPLRVWTDNYMADMTAKIAKYPQICTRITDESNDLSVRITAYLAPGALALLEDMGDSAWTSGVEEFFALREHMDSHINLMGRNGEVLSLDSYEAIFYHWFPMRKELYARRVEREAVLCGLRAEELRNVIRYVELVNEMTLARRSRSEMCSVLAGAGLAKIDSGLLHNPGFTRTEDLRRVVMSGTYDYLLRMSALKTSIESLTKYRAKLAAVEGEIAAIERVRTSGRFSGAEWWLSELDKLEAAVVEGQKTFWLYGEYGKFKYDS